MTKSCAICAIGGWIIDEHRDEQEAAEDERHREALEAAEIAGARRPP